MSDSGPGSSWTVLVDVGAAGLQTGADNCLMLADSPAVGSLLCEDYRKTNPQMLTCE